MIVLGYIFALVTLFPEILHSNLTALPISMDSTVIVRQSARLLG